jgi:phosphatidylserine/phosphatidylglycerophosphate/cardiolipin synthase-like enzyme
VITPENFHERVKQLLRSARHSVRIEQQYIRGGHDPVAALLQELKAARDEHADLDIRIIVSPKFLLEPYKSRFFQLMREFSLEFDENFRFLSPLHFVHCHNKLVIVDDEKVLLGSQNWSTTGLLSNREAGLLVEHAGIACYFGRIFDADWTMSEPSAAPPDEVLAGLVGGLLDPSDYARGGVALSTTGDYDDV